MKNKIIVKVKNLTTYFNKKTSQEIAAVNNFSFEFEENKIHYIIGNSGSGKSTFVQHLNGLIKSDAGNIYIGNFKILESSKKIADFKKLRSFVSIVFQYPEYQIFKDTIRNEIMFGPISFNLHKKMHFQQNFYVFQKWLNKNKKIIFEFFKTKNKSSQDYENFLTSLKKTKIKFRKKNTVVKNNLFLKKRKVKFDFKPISMEEIITQNAKKFLLKLGMDENFLLRSPFGLSGGQKRRVAIAGILAINPKILIFDEPTAGLDPQGIKEMMDIIKKERENGKTIFIITHSMDEVLEAGDNVVVMDEGKIIFSGTPYEVFLNKDLYKKTQIAKPKVINFIDELNVNNDRYKILYKKQPKTCEQLANEISKLLKL